MNVSNFMYVHIPYMKGAAESYLKKTLSDFL